jgi:eukaryotic-like serine/threonine-protein kinase
VYVAGPSAQTELTWFDRSGKELAKASARGDWTGISLSPDGNTVLTGRRDSNGQSSLWLTDLVRGSESRFFPVGTRGRAAYFPDSRRALFAGGAGGTSGLYQREVNEDGQAERLSPDTDSTERVPSAFSPDGRFLVFTIVDPRTSADIWYIPWEAKPDWRKAVRFMATEATESQGVVSPDGKWIAFTSNTAGVNQVYIRSFSDGAGMWKVSADQGREPLWSADGTELYYLRVLTANRATLLAAAVSVDSRGELQIGTHRELFNIRTRLVVPQGNTYSYAPHPDGRRFLVNALADEGETRINVITNWQKTISAGNVP